MRVHTDLHAHTTASDGDLTPTQLVIRARTRGLSTLAITDHDTLKGVEEGMDAGAVNGIRVLPGIEISAIYEPGTLHMLGYFRTNPAGLEEELECVQQGRMDRFPKIIKRLNEHGLMITQEDVTAIAGEAQIGRPHIAKALIQRGYVKDFDEAFDRWLAKGKPAYVEKEKLSWEEAIRLIRTHGGIPVLAHPFTLEIGDDALRNLVTEMKDGGLMGIEVYYPEHTHAQMRLYREIARTLGLVATGGTDFHGTDRNGADLGDVGLDGEHLRNLLTVVEQAAFTM